LLGGVERERHGAVSPGGGEAILPAGNACRRDRPRHYMDLLVCCLNIHAGVSRNQSLRTTQLKARYELREGIQAPRGSRTQGCGLGVSVAGLRRTFKASRSIHTHVNPIANRKQFPGNVVRRSRVVPIPTLNRFVCRFGRTRTLVRVSAPTSTVPARGPRPMHKDKGLPASGDRPKFTGPVQATMLMPRPGG